MDTCTDMAWSLEKPWVEEKGINHIADVFTNTPVFQEVPSSSPEHTLFESAIIDSMFEPLADLFPDPCLLSDLLDDSGSSSAEPSPSSPPSPPNTRGRQKAKKEVSGPTKAIKKATPSGGPKRKRKRPKHMPTSITISNNALRTMTCEDIDAMAAKIEAQRPLTAEEEADFKAYKRRIMNRISAKESRQKKQELIKDISDALDRSNQRNSELMKIVKELEAQNQKLRAASGMPQAPPVTLPTDDDEQMSDSSSDCTSPGSSPSSPSMWAIGSGLSKAPASAGICLFVMLLSFGVMFTALQPGDYNNHSQLSALAPLLTQHGEGRAITNDVVLSVASAPQLDRDSIDSYGAFSVASSRTILQVAGMPEKKLDTKVAEVKDIFQSNNGTNCKESAEKGYDVTHQEVSPVSIPEFVAATLADVEPVGIETVVARQQMEHYNIRHMDANSMFPSSQS